MSDHYDYGYCDYHDTYHDDVKQAHQMQEPRQPTSEELDEIFRIRCEVRKRRVAPLV